MGLRLCSNSYTSSCRGFDLRNSNLSLASTVLGRHSARDAPSSSLRPPSNLFSSHHLTPTTPAHAITLTLHSQAALSSHIHPGYSPRCTPAHPGLPASAAPPPTSVWAALSTGTRGLCRACAGLPDMAKRKREGT